MVKHPKRLILSKIHTAFHMTLLIQWMFSESSALWAKFSSDDVFFYFFLFIFFPQKRTGFDIPCKLTICIKWQRLFSRKNKKNIINLSSAEFAQSGKV